jgi:hypothetical protein
MAHFVPNKGLELTASSARSYLAPASGSSSGLALAGEKPVESVTILGKCRGQIERARRLSLE